MYERIQSNYEDIVSREGDKAMTEACVRGKGRGWPSK
jgi:hypothetical protein